MLLSILGETAIECMGILLNFLGTNDIEYMRMLLSEW